MGLVFKRRGELFIILFSLFLLLLLWWWFSLRLKAIEQKKKGDYALVISSQESRSIR
ncbi:MAG TPA: hypothetical protein VFV31_14625 [Chitinophagaceae bacterium]|nr:hypothetical protein [Chitinophagaceae bacterium]